jgi:hypothetical protein
VPDRAGLFTLMVNTEEPEPDTVEELHEAEVRCGKPLKLRETVPVYPCSAETVIVSDLLPPRGICRVVGEAEREKSPAELTFSVTFTE